MTRLGLFQLYGYQDSEDIPDTLTCITELPAPVEMIQLLQTSWEDRFRVSREGQLALGFWLGWFSLEGQPSRAAWTPLQLRREGWRDAEKLTQPSAKGLKKKKAEKVLVLYSCFTHAHTRSAWLQEASVLCLRKILRSS